MSRSLSHVLAAVFAQPWLMEPERAKVLAGVVLRRAAGHRVVWTGMEDDFDSRPDPNALLLAESRVSAQKAGIEVISLQGALVHRGAMHNTCGMTSTELISAKLRKAANDSGVGTILLDIDSPGGEVSGTPELAAQIASIEKPVVAHANSMAASAAYWIASAADELVVTPSGEVGSIGVVMLHEDDSKHMAEEHGVVQTVISAGEFKAELWGPLSDEAKAALQQRANAIYGDFIAGVAKGRGVSAAAVREHFGKGRIVSAKAALDAGMVDRIATFQDTLDRLLAGGRVRRRSTPGATARDDMDLRERELDHLGR